MAGAAGAAPAAGVPSHRRRPTRHDRQRGRGGKTFEDMLEESLAAAEAAGAPGAPPPAGAVPPAEVAQR